MSVKIYEITKPRRLWQVYYVHQGKRIRKHFPSIEQAEAYRREIAAVINLGGTGALHLDVMMRADYTAARTLLDQNGWQDLTLLELARDFTKRTQRLAAADTPIAPLLEEFIRTKKEDENKSARWVATLRLRCWAWVHAQAVATLQDVTREAVLALRSRPKVKPRTKVADMAAVSTFMGWLVSEKWLQTNPLDDVKRPSTDVLNPKVLSAAQIAALLHAARELEGGRLLRYFALAIYAGLRPSEIERLRPENVRLGAPAVVRVVGGKRRQRVRVVPILPTLLAWWQAGPEHWPVLRRGHADAKLFDQIRRAAGLVQWTHAARCKGKMISTDWQNDICRHTYISLRMAMTHDENLVAMEAGNSPDVIHAHYLSMIDDREAAAMLAILP